MSDTPTPYRARCLHLTCKSMMVYGDDFEQDPEYQGGMTEFTCLCTFSGYGPDGEMASMDACCNPERTCYKEY